eukprot:scaffold10594_cov118-Amphora_coffeaeformis.AAC.2
MFGSSTAFGSSSSSNAPAPPAGGGGFSFGSGGNAPAPTGGGGGGGFSFGNNPAPAPSIGAFGAAPTTTTTTAFGGGSAFGATAPAPSAGGFSFGSSNPAPAPFGSPAPATNTGGFGSAFGSNPAPAASSWGNPAPAPFGSTLGQQQEQQQQQHVPFTGKTLYKDLPQQYRQSIDQIVDKIMNHRRTMARVQSMGPSLLVEHDDGKGGKYIPLHAELNQLRKETETFLMPQVLELYQQVVTLREAVRDSMTSTILYAKWPIEAQAAHRQVSLTMPEEKKDDRGTQIHGDIQSRLERQMVHVDRIQKFPSPFFWQALEDFQGRLQQLQAIQDQIKARAHQEDWDEMPVTYLIMKQDE